MDRSRPRVFAAFLLLAGLAVPATADVVTLDNGVKMTGVLSKAEDGLTLRVSEDGYVVLDTATIVSIQRASKADNDKLVAAWKESDEEAARAEKAKADLEDRQTAKGLVKYDGEWMTPSQFDRRLAIDRLELERIRESRAAVPFVSYSYNYYYSAPSNTFVYSSFGAYSRPSFHGGPRSNSYAVPLSPSGVRSYGISPISGRYSAPSTLFDHEAGMGAGAHHGW